MTLRCSVEDCDRFVSHRGMCEPHYRRQLYRGHTDPLGFHSHERYWPTDNRRPGETVFELCRRLDGYYNAPGT